MANYSDLIKKRSEHYKAIRECYCPILQEEIVFNSKGLRHFKYNGKGRARSRKEHMYRMGLVPLIKPVIQTATKISKYTPPIYVKSLDKFVEYWELKEKVGKQKTTVTVILRRIGTGNIIFYSVWKK